MGHHGRSQRPARPNIVGLHIATLVLFLTLSPGGGAHAVPTTPVGWRTTAQTSLVRHTVFVLEKSYNFENVLVVYVLLNSDCSFRETDNGGRPINFYWSMGANDPRTTSWEKTPHPLIMRETNARLGFAAPARGQTEGPAPYLPHHEAFQVTLDEVDRYVKHDLPDVAVEVSTTVVEGACELSSVLQLGPSGGHRRIELESVYGEAKLRFGLPMRGVEYIVLRGSDVLSGESIQVRFESR